MHLFDNALSIAQTREKTHFQTGERYNCIILTILLLVDYCLN